MLCWACWDIKRVTFHAILHSINIAFELTLQGFFPLSDVTGNFSLFSIFKQNKACHLWYYADLENVVHRFWSFCPVAPRIQRIYMTVAYLN